MSNIEVLSYSKLKPFLQMTFPHFQKKIAKCIDLNNFVALGAQSNGLPIALVLAQLDEREKTVELASLYVEREFRGIGLGTSLMHALSEEVMKRGFKKITLTYMTNDIMHLFLEKILDKCGFEQGVTKNLFLELDKGVAASPLLHKLPPLPVNYEIFPFCELTSEERNLIQMGRGTLYSEELDPFLGEENLEPLNSYGLRHRKEIVGWMINHRIAPDTIRYTRLWVRNDVRKQGLGMHLIARSTLRQVSCAAEVGEAVVVLSLDYPAMIRFAEKRLVPFSNRYYESKSSVKYLKKRDS
jgi:predicted GNAT family acetyltransferase